MKQLVAAIQAADGSGVPIWLIAFPIPMCDVAADEEDQQNGQSQADDERDGQGPAKE